MVDTVAPTRNAAAPWGSFSSQEYWRHNYLQLLPADKEIIDLVRNFFVETLYDRPRVQYAIDVGSGTNLYPALLALPWAEHILLTDYSDSNLSWLHRHVMDEDDNAEWTWQPFWHELQGHKGYDQVSDPRQELRKACAGQQGHSGIERHSIFDLPPDRWQMGTMFFVAESITRERKEFAEAVGRFTGSLQAHSPFAAAFMSGSHGYKVGNVTFPATPITAADIRDLFARLHVGELEVKELETSQRVREGYEGMIVATGITGGH